MESEPRQNGPTADAETLQPAKPPALITEQAVDVSSLRRTDLQVMIETAHRYPRRLSEFIHDATVMVTVDADVAASCYFRLKRKSRQPDGSFKDTPIEGPSIRLMEIAASCWSNIRYGAVDIKFDEESAIGIGFSHDVEKNVERVTITKRRILDRNGRKYSTDMQMVTGNAAAAIATRNALRGVIPEALIQGLMRKARATHRGDIKSFNTRRQEWLERFTTEHKVPRERILEYLEVKAIEDMSWDHVEDLSGLHTGIVDGEPEAVEILKDLVGKPAGEKSGAEKTAEKIKTATGGKATREPGAEG